MKKFISEYLKIIAYTSLGLVFMITSFYLLINYYHSAELKNHIYISSNDINYKEYQTKLIEISNNLNIYKAKKLDNPIYDKMYNKLLTCNTVLKEEGTLRTFETDKYHPSNDVYQLGTTFQSNALNICYALHLSYLNKEDAPKEFKKFAPFIQNTVNILSNQTQFALDEIKGNSSYFYSTNITSSTIRNPLESDYQIISSSYNEFASVILELSKIINESDNLNEGGSDND